MAKTIFEEPGSKRNVSLTDIDRHRNDLKGL